MIQVISKKHNSNLVNFQFQNLTFPTSIIFLIFCEWYWFENFREVPPVSEEPCVTKKLLNPPTNIIMFSLYHQSFSQKNMKIRIIVYIMLNQNENEPFTSDCIISFSFRALVFSLPHSLHFKISCKKFPLRLQGCLSHLRSYILAQLKNEKQIIFLEIIEIPDEFSRSLIKSQRSGSSNGIKEAIC